LKHLVVGIVALVLGIAGLIMWWDTFGMVMRGVVPFCLIVVGLIAMLSGWRRMPTQGGADAQPRGGDNPSSGEQ